MATSPRGLEHRCFSLVHAVGYCLERSGQPADPDDLAAALGHSLMICAVPSEEDHARWPMYARDGLLVEAANLFGMTIRAVHPPEAAIGLHREEAFGQHFDASYRPFILAALKNRQPVLAWRGWGGEEALSWGVIQSTCDDGVGFAGTVWAAPDRPEAHVLRHPPAQLYTVERIDPVSPPPEALAMAAIDHAARVLDSEFGAPFGAITGSKACDLWRERAAEGSANAAFAAAIIDAHGSALRFFERARAAGSTAVAPTLERLLPLIQDAIDALGAASTSEASSAIGRARDVYAEMATILGSATSASGAPRCSERS